MHIYAPSSTKPKGSHRSADMGHASCALGCSVDVSVNLAAAPEPEVQAGPNRLGPKRLLNMGLIQTADC